MFALLAAAAPKTTGGMYFNILIWVGLLAVMYLLLIRPQQQRQKQHQALVNSLAENDKVVAAGGVYGTIVKVKDKSVIIKIAENTKIEVVKTAVSFRVDEEEKAE